MKKVFATFIFALVTLQLFSQSPIKTKEIKISHTNGYEIFKICISGCQTIFDDQKEYFWYTEFSNVKSTKGGIGGDLLHGNYKLYDENGNLRKDRNYYMGVPDGSEKSWDSTGNIISQIRYKKGKIVYWKYQNEDKNWIEWIGTFFEAGTKKKIYNQFNELISEELTLPDFKQHVKLFYENSGKLKEEFTTAVFSKEYLSGEYTSYYENGNIEVSGHFLDGAHTSVRVGIWRWYNEDGRFDSSETYKSEIENWPNGKNKIVGGYIYNSENKSWLKTGQWHWFDESGKLIFQKEYEGGVEK